MMQKKLLLFSTLLLATSAVGQSKSSTYRTAPPTTWVELATASRLKLIEESAKLPPAYTSPLFKSNMQPERIRVDITGWNQIVLSVWGSLDGVANDFGTFADARLIRKDGSSVNIAELKNRFASTRGIIRNSQEVKRRAVIIDEVKYFNTFEMAGNAQIVLNNENFVALEATIGVDKDAWKGSVVFQVRPFSGEEQSKSLEANFLNTLTYVSLYNGGDFSYMLNAGDAEIEKSVALRLCNRLKQPTYWRSRITETANKSLLSDQIRGYNEIIASLTEVINLQDKLEWLNIAALEESYKSMLRHPNFDATANQKKMESLKQLTTKGFSGIYLADALAISNAKEALLLKREVTMANPILDFDRIVMARYSEGATARSINPSHLGTPPNNWSNQTSARRGGFNAQIVEMSNLRAEQPTLKTLFKPANGSSLPDLNLHWNADRMMFTMNQPGDHHWQVYEMGVDGGNVNQITQGSKEDLDYFEAAYLPNGKIAVLSNVGSHGVPCVDGNDQVGNLSLYDPKTHDMRRLTFDQDANWNPVVMHNGKIMYTRWEYEDLTHYFSRFVMHMNPDGTEQKALYGSGSIFPNSTFDMQPLPNHPTRFVGVISGHHGTIRSGRLVIFDPAVGRKEEKGMVQELPYRNRPIIPIMRDEMVDGVWPQFIKPYPLDNDHFLVTAKLSPTSLWGLYLIDTFDNLTLIHEYEGEGFIHAIPVQKRTTPPSIPDKTNQSSKEATVFIQDIYEGEGLPGVPRGAVKELRVFTYEYSYIRSPSNNNAQGIQSGWDIKRLLGTVPVESDGSVIFKIPANTPISLQPLDSQGRAIQWMRSWLTGMPGETVSCVGCHEDQNQIPIPKKVIASTRPPHELKAPEGGVRSITFDLEIQPILDRNCIACHDGTKNAINYTAGRKDEKGFNKSYLDFHPYIRRQGPEAGMKVLYPYEYHANTSPLVQMLTNGHHGVELSKAEWQSLYQWIDFNAPDKGTFEVREDQFINQYQRRIDLANKYAGESGVNWRSELKEYAAYLESQPKQAAVKTNYKEPQFKETNVKSFPFVATPSSERKVVEIASGITLSFIRIPAGSFIMGANKAGVAYAPAHKAAVEKAFWMMETEITNQQMLAILSDHDSRYVDQQWKDHVNEGYPANLPNQPASRVSWQQAIEFSEIVAKRTGLKMNLPTEVQWEWACRGGQSSDFWYGNLNSDFGKYENLSDKQMLNMAVAGVDPKPMSTTHQWYPYYIWHPKMESVDDGNMLMTQVASYQANPFGLYDMHGNVAEWTRCDFLPYPYQAKKQGSGDHKVVRGGSWIDHPKHATSAARRAYYPWQKPFNVGFRLIIED